MCECYLLLFPELTPREQKANSTELGCRLPRKKAKWEHLGIEHPDVVEMSVTPSVKKVAAETPASAQQSCRVSCHLAGTCY